MKASLIWSAFGKSEEIDDGTLSPEVPSSISPRPLGGLEFNARGRGRDEASEAGNSVEKMCFLDWVGFTLEVKVRR